MEGYGNRKVSQCKQLSIELHTFRFTQSILNIRPLVPDRFQVAGTPENVRRFINVDNVFIIDVLTVSTNTFASIETYQSDFKIFSLLGISGRHIMRS